jgi:hypothetical protein
MPDPVPATPDNLRRRSRPHRPGSRLLSAWAGACLAGLLFLAGCAKGGKTATFGSSEDLLAYGEYSAQTPNASGHMIRLKLNQNGTYIRKKFLGTCQVSESKGEWSATNEVVEFRLQEIRQRPDCQAGEWTTEKSDKVSERNIRSITPTSFELLDQEETSSAEWVKFVKR